MIRSHPKNSDVRLSKNFWLHEFHCCCKYDDCVMTLVSDDLIKALQALRDKVGILTLDSGFRCEKHNSDVGGRPDSMHLLGVAADVKSNRLFVSDLAAAAEQVPLFKEGGIGVYFWGCHLDCRGIPARWRG